MIRYKYNQVEYPNLTAVRQAVWDNEHKVYGDLTTSDQFAEAGIVVEFIDVPDPEVPQEIVAERVRESRDRMLSDTDFYLISDYPIDEQDLAEIKQYRQALRDIPSQPGFPTNVEWPTEPQVLR